MAKVCVIFAVLLAVAYAQHEIGKANGHGDENEEGRAVAPDCCKNLATFGADPNNGVKCDCATSTRVKPQTRRRGSLFNRRPGSLIGGRRPGSLIGGRRPGSLIGRRPGSLIGGRRPGSLFGRRRPGSLIGRRRG